MDDFTPALPPGFKLPKSSDSASTSDEAKADSPPPLRIGPIGPAMPPGFQVNAPVSEDSDSSSSSSDSDDDDKEGDRGSNKPTSHPGIGPALPGIGPALPGIGPALPGIGPALPPGFVLPKTQDVPEDDGYVIGPVPHKGPQVEYSAAEEFERRAQRMKDKLLNKDKEEDSGPQQRETWMTELPEFMKKKVGISVEAKSSFSRSKCTAVQDESWTETPAEREKREEEERLGLRRPRKRAGEEDLIPSTRDLQMQQEVVMYNKKTKRGESLVEMHQRKMHKKEKKEMKKEKKKQKKARKKAKKEGKVYKEKKPERVAFDRERDLQTNVFDDAMKKQALKKSAGMNSRFKSSGTEKFL